MTTISAKTILRSRNIHKPDKVLTTLLLRYPRFIHAEMMTHRVFSRNSASSRAIPVEKLIQDVMDNPAKPIHWGKNKPGMQASEECFSDILIGSDEYISREEAWLRARDYAVDMARAYAKVGYHKQIANRLLEPFAHITVLVSATEWDNFLELRDHEDAEPHIQMLAKEIRKCLDDESTIQELSVGDYHLPFVSESEYGKYSLTDLISLSVARCASTSYKTVNGFDMTIERANDIFEKLIASKPMHASPCEHIAMADYYENEWDHPELHGNFIGFSQYRHILGS